MTRTSAVSGIAGSAAGAFAITAPPAAAPAGQGEEQQHLAALQPLPAARGDPRRHHGVSVPVR